MGRELSPMNPHILSTTLVKYSYRTLKFLAISMTAHSQPYPTNPQHEPTMISKSDARKIGSTSPSIQIRGSIQKEPLAITSSFPNHLIFWGQHTQLMTVCSTLMIWQKIEFYASMEDSSGSLRNKKRTFHITNTSVIAHFLHPCSHRTWNKILHPWTANYPDASWWNHKIEPTNDPLSRILSSPPL